MEAKGYPGAEMDPCHRPRRQVRRVENIEGALFRAPVIDKSEEVSIPFLCISAIRLKDKFCRHLVIRPDIAFVLSRAEIESFQTGKTPWCIDDFSLRCQAHEKA